MAGGAIDYTTPALMAVGTGGAAENTFYDIPLDADILVDGNNVLATEIHQIYGISSDISFDLSLTASTGVVDTLVAR